MFEPIKTQIYYLILISAVFTCSGNAKAELILSVDWDTTKAGVQHEVNVLNGEITADLVVELTGDTNIFGYNFSVRYDSQVLKWVSRDESMRPTGFVDDVDPAASAPEPEEEKMGDGFLKYRQLSLFNGINYDTELTSTQAPIGGGATLGRITFRVLEAPAAGSVLVRPGLFNTELVGDSAFDGFSGIIDGQEVRLPVSSIVLQPGSITAVPEPSSLLLLAFSALGFLGFKRRKVAQ